MKELKEEIIEAVQDATDKVNGTVSIPILDHFLDEILNEKCKIGDVMHWVAVSENKPEVGQWILVYAPSGRHIAWYNGFQFDDRASYNIEGVTHWIHIPEPPCVQLPTKHQYTTTNIFTMNKTLREQFESETGAHTFADQQYIKWLENKLIYIKQKQ